MRITVLAAASMLTMVPVAYGQMAPGSSDASPPASSPGGMSYSDQGASDMSGRPVGAPTSTRPDPNNCGTPDEPKPCAPRAHRAYRAQ
jgi:hypothetical protein